MRQVFQWVVGRRLSPPQLIILSYLLAMAAGALLLSMPWAHARGHRLTLVDALFTATSALAVTGLTTVSTGGDFSFWGQLVLLGLIQIGGLGIMTFSVFLILLVGGRVRISQRLLIRDALNAPDLRKIVRLIQRIFLFTFTIELFGTVLLYLSWQGQLGWQDAAWPALFHAISAFCNAGFSIWDDSLLRYQTHLPTLLVVMGLIILGGIGFRVLEELFEFLRRWLGSLGRPSQGLPLSLHTKLVLVTSGVLIVLGAALLLLLELPSQASAPWPARLSVALFQAVTARTAGLNTMAISRLREGSILVLMMLMFIGASPMSTGGGIKTVTFSLFVLSVVATVRGRTDITAFERRIERSAVLKANLVLVMSLVIISLGTMLLSASEHFSLRELAFEVVSATNTVGLSLGITSLLSDTGKLLVSLLMLIGRVGPLTVVLALGRRLEQGSPVRYPTEGVIIG
ncbi:MAG: hypothetical protein HY335_09835 [Deinococcus sp.]|nr:hypothetical protein [Deinococcus sp.]